MTIAIGRPYNLLRRIVGLGAVNILYSAVNFGLSIYIARVFGTEIFSAYAILTATIAIFSLVCSAGLDTVLLRAEDGADLQRKLYTANTIVLVATVLMIPVMFFTSFPTYPDALLDLLVCAITVYFIASNTVKQGFAVYHDKQGAFQAIDKFSRILCLVVGLVLLSRIDSPHRTQLFAVVLLAYAVSYFLTNRLLAPLGAHQSIACSSMDAGLIKPAGLLLAVNVLVNVLSAADPILIAHIGTTNDVAVYAAAHRFSLAASVAVYAINSALVPALLKHADDAAKASIRIGFYVAVTLSLMYFIACVVAGREMLSVFGAEFSAGYLVLVFLAGANLASVAFGQTLTLMKINGAEKQLFWIMVSALVVKFTVSLTLFDYTGPVAFAVGGLLAIGGWNVACAIHLNRRFGIDPRGKVSCRRRR